MTTTADKTKADVLDDASLTNIADILAQVKLGTLLTPQTRTITQTSAVTVTLDPPALGPATCNARVTTGTALAGLYRVGDTNTTEVDSATLGIASLSDDGATLTFAAAVTGVVVDYLPRSAADITADFNTSGNG